MNLLVTGSWQCTAEQLNGIKNIGHEVIFMQYEKDELPCDYEWVEGAVCNGLFLSHSIEKFTNLKYIQLTSAGFDRVPMDYVKEHNIEIHNAGGVYSIPMAEYALAGVLSLYKKQAFFYENQKRHTWEKTRDLIELSGKKVCILGCGSVGTECAKRFEAFGCMVYGIDTKLREHKNFFCIYHWDEAKEVLAKSDIVVITLPLTHETYHMFNKAMFDAMKDGVVVVNIARGALIESQALIDALKIKLGGAVLDVFEEEPLDTDSPLWDLDNVVITPHNCFEGKGNKDRLEALITRNLWKVNQNN